jgi:hypothetical protein
MTHTKRIRFPVMAAGAALLLGLACNPPSQPEEPAATPSPEPAAAAEAPVEETPPAEAAEAEAEEAATEAIATETDFEEEAETEITEENLEQHVAELEAELGE